MTVESRNGGIERSAPKGAVFLSYASQDAEAAKRIADALRAAGVEVWFDQSELVGGDAWDAKIRKQIGSCALFVPIISAGTQARAEGYFRLEWKLADRRTDLIGKSKAFLLPVCIDDTRDTEADVPDSFTAVQWTRLKGGVTTPTFVARVQKLLGGSEVGGALRPDRTSSSGYKTPPTTVSSPGRKVYAVVAITAFAIAGAVGWWVMRDRGPAAQTRGSVSELDAIRARMIPDRWQKGDFEAIAPALDRILEKNPEDAEAWALRSIIHSLQTTRNLDPGTKPLEAGKAAAERALRLAPEAPLANLALGMHLVANVSRGGDLRVFREPIDRAVAALPSDALTRYVELVSFWLGFDFENSERVALAWLETEPGSSYPAWIMAQLCMTTRRPADLEKWSEQAMNGTNTVTKIRALCSRFDGNYYLQADLGAARATLDRVPLLGQTIARVAYARWLLAMAEQDWGQALQVLAALPDAMLFDVNYNGPKALLAGLAHQRAGRADAAASQFREAERLLREHLAVDPDNEALRASLAVTLASAGQSAEARRELALVEPLVGGRPPMVYRTRLIVSLAQSYGAMGDHAKMAEWLRKLFAEPSGAPLTPASLRLDARFNRAVDAPEIQALLKEFAHLDPPAQSAAASAADGKSVAVLAFANLSSDKEQEYFSDGISEEVLNVLAKVPGLKVSARTSAFYFKGKQVPMAEIAQQLGVAYVVEGSVQRAGDRVKITAQLIKAADGFHVWSDSYTRDMRDIFAVQDEIAAKIVTSLTDKLGMSLPVSAKTSPEAYTLYLQARATLAKRGVPNLREAVRMFDRVIALDPDYLPARSGLAISLALIPAWSRSLALGESLDMINRARREARLVIERQPGNAEAWSALGYMLAFYDWRWEEAGEAVARSLALAPNDAEILNFAGDYYRIVLADPQVVETEKRAVELNPLQSVNHTDLSVCYIAMGQYELAIEPGRRGISIAPELVENYEYLLRPYGLLKRFEEMRAVLAEARRVAPENSALFANMEILAAIYEGRNAEALQLLGKFRPHVEQGGYSPAEYGSHYLRLGQPETAVPWLMRGAKGHDISLIDPTIVDLERIAADPVTRVVLEEPGLKELKEIRARHARAAKTQK